jgi:hypothetical protein
LGALEKIKRGKWCIVAHIPEWFYSKHMNYLLGYSDKITAEDRSVLEASGCPAGIIDNIFIPSNQRHNPFKQEDKVSASTEFNLQLELIKLYDRCDADNKLELLEKYPDLDKASRYAKEEAYEFGTSYTVTDKCYFGPLMINKWLIPGLQYKALAVSSYYEPVIIKENGTTFIYFKKSI